ncbi:MAG TPA: GDSL-type esterase/lipase family protein [Candidatus Limnocylindrales bacterium]|jgi:lysophospholipase L1-like esterase
MDATIRTGAARGRGGIGLAIAVAIAALIGTAAVAAGASYPKSIASTGDSITRAYNTGFFPYTDNPSASWSTGTNSTVNSHYRRLLALNPAISGHAYNDAKSGARMIDLNGQIGSAANQGAEYVTVLMGGNDVCTSRESLMTSVANYRTQFQAAMTTITSRLPTVRVFVASIPNVYNLWALFKNNSSARSFWALFGVCQSMLANPLSTAQSDVDRRARVLRREVDFNSTLASVCAAYTQCRFDANALFNYAFPAADVSTGDYFHPSLYGQRDLAAVSWAAGYWP